MLIDDVSKWVEKTKIKDVIEAIENNGCIIVNPNYNPVKGIKGGLILRSADQEWLIGAVLTMLESTDTDV